MVREGQAGERRGTRPSFASPRDARPVPSPGYGAARDAACPPGVTPLVVGRSEVVQKADVTPILLARMMPAPNPAGR